MKRTWVLILNLLAACSSSHRAKAPPSVEQRVESVGQSVGAACTPDASSIKGSCPEGLLCFPGPGGFCTRDCATTSCPAPSMCAESPKLGEVCINSCESDSDCRKPYQCDSTWKGCFLPGMLSPRAPRCTAEAPPRSNFGAVRAVSTDKSPGLYHFEPAAAVLGDGSLAVVYITNGDRIPHTKSPLPNKLAFARIDAAGKVDGDHSFSSPNENHFDPWIDVDRKGVAHLVWLGFDGGRAPEKNMRIGYSTTHDGLSWSTPTTAHDPNDCPAPHTGCFDKPMIAIGPSSKNGASDAKYSAYFSAQKGAMQVARSEGGPFAGSSKSSDSAYGDIEVDSRGHIHIVGAMASPRDGFGADKTSIAYFQSSDGGKSFSPGQTVSAENHRIPFWFSNPQVVSNPRNNTLHVVYPAQTNEQSKSRASWDIYLATSHDGGKTWDHIRVNDDPHCANHMTPALTSDGTGVLHVAWLENRDGSGHVVYSECSADGKRCSKNERISDKPFAAYALVRHSPKWVGEYFSLVVDGRRNRLHAVWSQPVSHQGTAVGRIFHASRPL